MVRKFEVVEPGNPCEKELTEGQIVYSLKGHDYGLASDDSRHYGYEHISVTLDPQGDYPSFTIPRSHLREIKE